jgi:endoglycosylceramidase
VLQSVNVISASKGDPLRMPPVDRDDVLRIARDWGFNLDRFLVFWNAAEPEPGVYDEEYFARVQERLDWHRNAGIHVVLDMHQDVYSFGGISPLRYVAAIGIRHSAISRATKWSKRHEPVSAQGR